MKLSDLDPRPGLRDDVDEAMVGEAAKAIGDVVISAMGAASGGKLILHAGTAPTGVGGVSVGIGPQLNDDIDLDAVDARVAADREVRAQAIGEVLELVERYSPALAEMIREQFAKDLVKWPRLHKTHKIDCYMGDDCQC